MVELNIDATPKMIKETMARIQSLAPSSSGPDSDIVQKIIDECDRHRPIGPEGRHGQLHTETCGCEDVPVGNEPHVPSGSVSYVGEVGVEFTHEHCPSCEAMPYPRAYHLAAIFNAKVFCPDGHWHTFIQVRRWSRKRRQCTRCWEVV